MLISLLISWSFSSFISLIAWSLSVHVFTSLTFSNSSLLSAASDLCILTSSSSFAIYSYKNNNCVIYRCIYKLTTQKNENIIITLILICQITIWSMKEKWSRKAILWKWVIHAKRVLQSLIWWLSSMFNLTRCMISKLFPSFCTVTSMFFNTQLSSDRSAWNSLSAAFFFRSCQPE